MEISNQNIKRAYRQLSRLRSKTLKLKKKVSNIKPNEDLKYIKKVENLQEKLVSYRYVNELECDDDIVRTLGIIRLKDLFNLIYDELVSIMCNLDLSVIVE